MGLNYGLQRKEPHWAAAGLLVGGPPVLACFHMPLLSGGHAQRVLHGLSISVRLGFGKINAGATANIPSLLPPYSHTFFLQALILSGITSLTASPIEVPC